MSKVFVIGNGFDIALGLRSKYSDYINVMSGTSKNAFWPFRDLPKGKFSECSLERHFYDYFHPNLTDNSDIEKEFYHVKWIDVEAELLNYVRTKIGKPIDADLAMADEHSFKNLKMMLQKYISVMPTIEPKSPETYIIALLEAIKTDGCFDKAYSFNYTDLENELIRFAKFNDTALPKIVNVHHAPSNDNPFNIVLGINEDASIPKEYRFLFKSMQTEPTDLAQDLANADEVIFYGLSFGEIDFPYFKAFFELVSTQSILSSKKHITIFTFGKDGVDAIWDRLHEIGVLIHTLKERSYFSIIDVNNIKLPGYDETAFKGLINRLESK